MEAPLFFLKRTGRRAARYIKKKGARRAKQTTLALYKAEHGSRKKGWRTGRPTKKRETTTPRAPPSAWRPPSD